MIVFGQASYSDEAGAKGVVVAPPEMAYPLDQWQTSTHQQKTCGLHDQQHLETRRAAWTVGVEHWCGSWLKYEEG